jgi:transposase
MKDVYKPMTFSEIASKYKVSIFVLRKWFNAFIPDMKRPESCYTYTSKQLIEIVSACGEFPEDQIKP